VGCVFATGWHVDLNVGGAPKDSIWRDKSQLWPNAASEEERETKQGTHRNTIHRGEPEAGAGPHSQASAGKFAMDTHLHSCSRPSAKALC
jgi:hypothetical protein